jgi:hypothetical protein
MSEIEDLDAIEGSLNSSGPQSDHGQAVSRGQRRRVRVLDKNPLHGSLSRSRLKAQLASSKQTVKPVSLAPVQFTRRHDGQSQA